MPSEGPIRRRRSSLLPPNFKQRRYFAFPVWANLQTEVKHAAERAQKSWDSMVESGLLLASTPTEVAPHLLTVAYEPDGSSLDPAIRLEAEARAFSLVAPHFAEALMMTSAGRFIEILEELAGQLTGSLQGLRSSPVVTTAGWDGVSILFPRAGTLRTRLGRLHQFLQTSDGPATYKAVVAMTALTNCHPFSDGNGRVSRVLANLVLNLHRAPADGLILPLYDLGNRPRGNLTLYLRAAELQGDWGGLLSFLDEAISASTRPS